MAQDLSSVRALVEDEKLVLVMARVALHEGEESHWYRTAEGQIAVRVLTHRHQAPIDAVLPSGFDDGRGFWGIPSIGTEVMIGFDGDYEDDAFVINVYGTDVPDLITTTPTRVVVSGSEVFAVSPGGPGVPLALKSDCQALTDYLKKQFDPITGHTHTSAAPGDPTVGVAEGTVGTGATTVPSPDGTTVLKAE